MTMLESRRVVVKRHATKMGRRTAFHAEAERIRQINLQAATVSEIYYADAQIKQMKHEQQNTPSKRRERYFRAFSRRSAQLREQIKILESKPELTSDDHSKLTLWKKMLTRDDDRAYGAIRAAVADPAKIGEWMWWVKILEYDRFFFVDAFRPVKSERYRLKKIFKLPENGY